MKLKKIFQTVFLFSLLILPLQLIAQDEKEVSFKEVLDSKQFKIEVLRAYPQSGPLINLTTAYSLAVNRDSINSYLPYFGRAYSIPYDGGKGLIFKDSIDSYSIEKKRR